MLKIIFLLQKRGLRVLGLHTRFSVVSAMSWTALRKAVVKVLGSETDSSGLEVTEDRPLPRRLERRMLSMGFNYLRKR